jgi:hypothetical protein
MREVYPAVVAQLAAIFQRAPKSIASSRGSMGPLRPASTVTSFASNWRRVSRASSSPTFILGRCSACHVFGATADRPMQGRHGGNTVPAARGGDDEQPDFVRNPPAIVTQEQIKERNEAIQRAASVFHRLLQGTRPETLRTRVERGAGSDGA